MANSNLNLYTRPRNESHERENWSKIEEFFTAVSEASYPTLTNDETVSVTFGQPVYVGSTGGLQLAQANDIATSEVVGLVYDDSISASADGRLIGDGYVEGTTAQWDTVTGESGGLSQGSAYFLDPDTAGMLTTTPPVTGSGDVIAPIGLAVNATTLKLDINHTIQLR